MTNKNENGYKLYEIIKGLSYALDLISNTVVGHHKRVAYITMQLARSLNLPLNDIKKGVLASLIHDIGIFYLNQDFSDLEFESSDDYHALVGFELLKEKESFGDISKIILNHHTDWAGGKTFGKDNNFVLSLIMYMADRTVVLVQEKESIFKQTSHIRKVISGNSNNRFWPEVVNEFLKLSKREYFWLDLMSANRIDEEISFLFEDDINRIGLLELLDICDLFSSVIDFRSPFTAVHSNGVAVTANIIGNIMNLNNIDLIKIKIAGYLHDIGKLAVPVSILDKSSKLNNDEWDIIKTHTYYTYYVLANIPGIVEIREWASFHHEKLNGNGYPFHLKEERLSLGSKILAVADVFTAISEDRPYRKSMQKEKAISVLDEMAKQESLDSKIVSIVRDNYWEINDIRNGSQIVAREFYDNFNRQLKLILSGKR